MSFQGNETAALDGNGRVPFPLSFRKLVPNEREFYISPGVDNCLHLRRVCDYEVWLVKLDQRVQAPENQTPENYARRRKLLHNTERVVLDDKQNRFLLPKKLKEWAGIDKDVVFSGNGDVVVISSVEKAAPYALNEADDFKGMEWIL
jgi:MraZ protein